MNDNVVNKSIYMFLAGRSYRGIVEHKMINKLEISFSSFGSCPYILHTCKYVTPAQPSESVYQGRVLEIQIHVCNVFDFSWYWAVEVHPIL